MAIDTENKRRSVQSYSLGLMRPAADAVIDMADRAAATWFYSGMNYSGTAPETNNSDWIVRERRRRGR